MHKYLLLFIFIISGPSVIIAQTDIDKMLKDITGKVDEIIIKSGGKEYTYSGDEAEKLFSALKENKKSSHFEFITKDDNVLIADSLRKKIIVKKFDRDQDEDIIVLLDKDDLDLEEDIEKFEKQIIIENDDAEKIVKVIINENGKESIQVYEGNAAEEYLDKLKQEEKIELNSDKNEKTRKTKKIIIEKRIEAE